MEKPALALNGVVKQIDKRPILRGIDLRVNEGESFGLAGVNGAGKTTLLKCLLNFCAFERGSIEIFGVDHKAEAARAPVAFLPERFVPPYYLRGSDYLKYFLSLQGVAYQQAAVDELCNALDLDQSALQRLVRTYSKGMTQKLGLAASFLANKRLYILDEPMSGLDPKARALLKQALQRLRERGCTIFFSSHSLSDVEEVCDRMGILHGGSMRFTGTTEDCKRHFGAHTLEQAFLNSIA